MKLVDMSKALAAVCVAFAIAGCGPAGGKIAKTVGKIAKSPATRVAASAGMEMYRHSDWNSRKCIACDGTGRYWNSYAGFYCQCAACGGSGCN